MTLITYLFPDGTLSDKGREVWQQLDVSEKLYLYQLMRSVRLLDRRMVLWQRQGRIGTYAPLEGQEAAQVGSAFVIDKEDWIFPSYREHGVAFTVGIPISNIIQYWRGQIEGCLPPAGYHYVPPTVPIATQLPHAVGAAWALKKRGQEAIAIAYFGDGATSEGDFHEALNFASVFQIPVIFFCQNNGYAISVPFQRQSATKTVAEKASAYNLDAYCVDGNDILAVYGTVKQAKERRNPVLIEAITYRIGAHTTADDASRYRTEQEVGVWMDRDPLYRYEQLCIREGLLDEETIGSEDVEWEKRLDETMRMVENRAPASPSQLFAHVYKELPNELMDQREEVDLGAHARTSNC
jgi:pyruvate dehydrogenase E1 component alpha subunit